MKNQSRTTSLNFNRARYTRSKNGTRRTYPTSCRTLEAYSHPWWPERVSWSPLTSTLWPTNLCSSAFMESMRWTSMIIQLKTYLLQRLEETSSKSNLKSEKYSRPVFAHIFSLHASGAFAVVLNGAAVRGVKETWTVGRSSRLQKSV